MRATAPCKHSDGYRACRSGFALVATLAIVTLMAIVIIAFLASLISERASSSALANATSAEFAAQAGVDLCIATLKAQFEAHPDSATVWEELLDDQKNVLTGATVFYYRTPADPDNPLHRLPLISGAKASTASEQDELAKLYEDPNNSVDLNRARYPNDATGWIGSPPKGLRAIRVPWVEMKSPDNPEKVIARYAFYAEDESFKLDVNTMGIAPRAQGIGDTPDQIPLQGLLQSILDSETLNNIAGGIHNMRSQFPQKRLPDLQALNQIPLGSLRLGEAVKFNATLHSATLNLSRSGAKRVNINSLVQSSVNPTVVRGQLDTIIAAIRHEAPGFGQRFYPGMDEESISKETRTEHEAIYLQKIAANIRDYIAPDSQPTIVNSNGTVALGLKPQRGIEPNAVPVVGEHHGGVNPVIAVGKKNVPFLQEFACRITLKDFTPNKGGASIKQAEYEFYLDYYFEFWNLTTRNISVANGDLGPNPFLRVYDQAAFDTDSRVAPKTYGTPGIPEGRPFEIPLPSNIVFPAGKVTVLTTDSDPSPLLVQNAENLFILTEPVTPPATPSRWYRGNTKYKTSNNEFRINIIPRNTATTDHATKMLLGNDNGIIESACALPLVRGTNSGLFAFQIHNDDKDTDDDMIDGKYRGYYLIRGGSLHGNVVYTYPGNPITGDPRTNNEQLYLCIYNPGPESSPSNREQTRYYVSGLDNRSKTSGNTYVPAQSTIGLQNSNFVDFTKWPDRFKPSPDHVDTPMYIANAPMKSIGELGHIFDPTRKLGPSGNILYSRGGGRTFTIGQPDPLWDQESFSASRERTAWRLTDIFSTTDDIRLPGRINLNGALRDGGAALKAALYGFEFTSGDDADPRLKGRMLSSTAIDKLVDNLCTRLLKTPTLGPLAERGELSELLNFHPNADPVDENADNLYDRGREELFRRLVELIATRGSVFSVYAIGQSIAHAPSGKKNVTATARIKITFELIPVWDPPLPETLASGTPADRLRPPSSFKVKILQASP